MFNKIKKEVNTSNYIETMHSQRDALDSVARELQRTASAFYATGNDFMGEALDLMSGDIEVASKNIIDAVSIDIHNNMIEQEKSTNKMIGLALSSILDEGVQ